MKSNKTQPTQVSVTQYIANIADEQRRNDAQELLELMSHITGQDPVMWGPSMVGFGSYHYIYDSGREGDMFRVGFAARASEQVLYGLMGDDTTFSRLGPHRRGKSCLYVKALQKIDKNVLGDIIKKSYTSLYYGEQA